MDLRDLLANREELRLPKKVILKESSYFFAGKSQVPRASIGSLKPESVM